MLRRVFLSRSKNVGSALGLKLNRDRIVLNISRWSCLFAIVVWLANCSSSVANDTDFFERKIRPVFVKHCYHCHSSKAKTLRGRLKLDSAAGIRKGGQSGDVISQSDVDRSRLLMALNYQGPKMPPDGQLPKSVIADFRKWIEQGANLPEDVPTGKSIDAGHSSAALDHYAFKRPEAETPPAVKDGSKTLGPIDRFVVARLEKDGLVPGQLATSEIVLRRLAFDLTGLPASLEQQREFLEDTHPDAYDRLVDRLLASSQFGERWGRHWLDLARYSESNGSDRNVIYPHAWRYNRYVIDSFNADRPFDQFIREQVAGDLLSANSQDQQDRQDRQLVATGFLTFGARTLMDDKPERFRMDRVDDQIDVVSRSILGLTVSCARCHDHKFDPISTADYYALAGIFRSTYLLTGPAAPAGNQYGHDRPLQPIGKNGLKLHGPSQKWQDKVAEQIKARNKARSDRYRVVRKKAAQENKLKMAMGKAKTDDAASTKAVEELSAEIKTLAAEITVWDEKIKKLDAELKETQDNPPPFPAYAMAVRDDEKIEDCKIRVAGEYNQLDELVVRGVPAGLSDAPLSIAKTESGRLQLAEWLTSRRNPLTARVAVNRIWQHLFGAGLVRSVDNFGVMGEKPSHPKLLDWMAVRFMEDQWSVKRMIRRIVRSRTYRLSSAIPANSSNSIDPANRLLWRQSQRRLEAEPLRDAMLMVSGELDRNRPAASPIAELKAPELNNRVFLTSEQLNGPVRTVYLPIARQQLPSMLKTFDFADPSLVTGLRSNRTTPAQQLFLLNDPFVMDRALMTARRVLDTQLDDDYARVILLYRVMFGRKPTVAERNRSMQYLNDVEQTYDPPTKIMPPTPKPRLPVAATTSIVPNDAREAAWSSLCHALIASGEFRYVE
jgi:hypothetical protein